MVVPPDIRDGRLRGCSTGLVLNIFMGTYNVFFPPPKWGDLLFWGSETPKNLTLGAVPPEIAPKKAKKPPKSAFFHTNNPQNRFFPPLIQLGGFFPPLSRTPKKTLFGFSKKIRSHFSSIAHIAPCAPRSIPDRGVAAVLFTSRCTT